MSRLAGTGPVTTKLAADYARLAGTVPVTPRLAADFARLVDAILDTAKLATSAETAEPGYARRHMIGRREVAVYLTVLVFLIGRGSSEARHRITPVVSRDLDGFRRSE
jgi:hypothetical protein